MVEAAPTHLTLQVAELKCIDVRKIKSLPSSLPTIVSCELARLVQATNLEWIHAAVNRASNHRSSLASGKV